MAPNFKLRHYPTAGAGALAERLDRPRRASDRRDIFLPEKQNSW
jgi:hypothetical protein